MLHRLSDRRGAVQKRFDVTENGKYISIMLLWCAYCQTFLKEKPPFDKLTITHGMCKNCLKRGIDLSRSEESWMGQLVTLQRELYAAGEASNVSKVEPLIKKCRDLGIRPIDMVFGFLNPMLVNIGERWDKGTLTVREEHRFTAFAESLLHAIEKKQSSKTVAQPKILLISADGNYHTFGLKLIHIWLTEEGIPSEVITPSLPTEEMVDYTKSLNPSFVGISVSLSEQVPGVKAFIKAMKRKPSPKASKILIGGYAVKADLIKKDDLPGAVLVKDLKQLRRRL